LLPEAKGVIIGGISNLADISLWAKTDRGCELNKGNGFTVLPPSLRRTTMSVTYSTVSPAGIHSYASSYYFVGLTGIFTWFAMVMREDSVKIATCYHVSDSSVKIC